MNACIVYEHVYMWISQMHGLYDHGIDCTKLCMAGSPLAPRDKYAHLPFGAGPHMCIGYRFALAEAVTTLIHVYKARTNINAIAGNRALSFFFSFLAFSLPPFFSFPFLSFF